ncbi:MAG: hypothetical protein Crog4KO_31560 [Crocinitomicaceae bacterium]
MVTEDGKTRAIVAHMTLIGWIVAVVMNNDKKDEFASFYIRQMLGLVLLSIASSIVAGMLIFIPVIGLIGPIIYLGVVALWVISLIGAVNGEKKELPVLGAQFQDWFKSL